MKNIILSSLLLVTAITNNVAGVSEEQRPLIGLDTVFLKIGGIELNSNSFEIDSQSKDKIAALIKPRLEKAGLNVISRLDPGYMFSKESYPIIFVQIFGHPHKNQDGNIMYGCQIKWQLHDTVILERDPSVKFPTITWTSEKNEQKNYDVDFDNLETFLKNKENEIKDNLFQYLKELTSEFAWDFGAANPRAKSSRRIILKEIHNAVILFKLDTGRYPSQEEGLEALVHQPAGLEGWSRYLNHIPKDEWDNPFVYQLNPENGKPFVIISYGQDGQEGGTGADADLYSTDQ